MEFGIFLWRWEMWVHMLYFFLGVLASCIGFIFYCNKELRKIKAKNQIISGKDAERFYKEMNKAESNLR